MSLVLVAVDGSDSSDRAVHRAAEIARERSAEVVVLHVVPTTFVRERMAQIDPSDAGDEDAFAQGVVDRALTLLAQRGIRAQGKVLDGAPSQALLDAARELRASVVVTGSRPRDTIIPEGSVSARVRSSLPSDVEVVVVA